MRKCYTIEIENSDLFKKQIIYYASQQEYSCVLDSNNFSSFIPGHSNIESYSFLAALEPIIIFDSVKKNNVFDELYKFWKKNKDWAFGHFAYDLKNNIEDLTSNHPDQIGFNDSSFFIPGILIEKRNTKFLIWYTKEFNLKKIKNLIQEINQVKIKKQKTSISTINKRISETEFIENIKKIKHHIQNGDIYEVNYCQEFYKENITIDTASTFINLCKVSPAPFSCFYKTKNSILISASPERFLKKSDATIFAQPMKGTTRKTGNKITNHKLRNELIKSKKEQSENIMIVDLVRNDLSRTSLPNSVNVLELCKVYEFPQVYQMISTIRSNISSKTKFTDTIQSCFPMGSMTGAPKIKAMEIIEKYEKIKRELYSGSVGYISPSGDFDFNVIIRSIQYNDLKRYLSFMTGGAITILSDPEKEYEECLIKTSGILKCLNASLSEND